MWLPIISMLLMWSLDTTDPNVASTAAVSFFVVHVVLIAVIAFIFFRISSANNNSPLVAFERPTGLLSSEAGPSYNTTVRAYDLAKWAEFLSTKLVLPVVIVGVMWYRYNLVLPLIIQCFHNPKQLYSEQIFQIFVLGKLPVGELSRPWPHPQPLGWLSTPSAVSQKKGAKQKNK